MLGTNQRTCDSCRDPQVVTIIGPRETYSGPLSHGALRQPRPARLHLLAFLQCSQQGRRSHNHCGDDHLSSRPHLPRSYTTSITLALASSSVVTASKFTTIIARLRRVKPNLTKQHSTDGRPVNEGTQVLRDLCKANQSSLHSKQWLSLVDRLAERMKQYEDQHLQDQAPTPRSDSAPRSGIWAAVEDIKKYEDHSGTSRRDVVLETGRYRRLEAMLTRMQNLDDVVGAMLDT